jgi:hypothetical protein
MLLMRLFGWHFNRIAIYIRVSSETNFLVDVFCSGGYATEACHVWTAAPEEGVHAGVC